MTSSPSVTNRPKTDQNTVKGLCGFKIKAIVELSTLEPQTVFSHLLDFLTFNEYVFGGYLSDWGKTTCGLMSLVGTCAQWD